MFTDENGQVISDLLVALLRPSLQASIPILARTNQIGQLIVRNLEAGSYELMVRSSQYRVPVASRIDVEPGKTAVLNLVLQQVFQFEASSEENIGIKSLLRSGSERRLIFRDLPDPRRRAAVSDSSRLFFDQAAIEMYSNAGLGGDYLVFPGDAASGTTTNFAVRQGVQGFSDYVFAGQLNSGEDSLWRLKNAFNLELSDQHSLGLVVGFSRTSFDQPSLSLLSNPMGLTADSGFIRAVSNIQVLNLGFNETLRWGDWITLGWGLEVDRVLADRHYLFWSPNASLAFAPLAGSRIQLLSSTRRSTRGNTVNLAEGDWVDLGSSVYLSQIGNELRVGTARHHEASFAQSLGKQTEVELAAFENRLYGAGVPVLAVLDYSPGREMLVLDGDQAHNSGYRFTLRRSFGDSFRAAVSLTQGRTTGLGPQRNATHLDAVSIREVLTRQEFRVIGTEIETILPVSQTRVMALVKLLAQGRPVATVDSLSDGYEIGNEGVNFFIRQLIPLPQGLLSPLGLDFLTSYQFEALLDIRNLMSQHVGILNTPSGDVLLVQSPRTIRGGIALKF